METYQGEWYIEGNSFKNSGIGELSIDNNKLFFNIRGDVDSIGPCSFIGECRDRRYKVYTHGIESTTYDGHLCKVEKAVLYKGDFSEHRGMEINNIESFSFEITELAKWINKKSVSWAYTQKNEFYVIENKIDKIILKNENPKIYIEYNLPAPFYNNNLNENVEILVRNTPKVYVEYKNAVNDKQVFKDILCVMRFFGIVCGHVSYAKDIRLDIQNQSGKMWMYYNYDFSFGLLNDEKIYKMRIEFEDIKEDLINYFEKWYKFDNNDIFELPKKMFFNINKKDQLNAQELFLNCCKILEGYDLRVSEDEIKADILGNSLRDALDSEEIKEKLKPIFEGIGSKYKARNVSNWIKSSFLERVSLTDRLKRIDREYFNVITKNAIIVNEKFDGEEYLKKIVKTRNYFSHYKMDDEGILSFSEICISIDILKCIITMILLTKMEIPQLKIKETMVRDSKYGIYANHLKNKE